MNTICQHTFLLTLFMLNNFATPLHGITAQKNITRFFSMGNAMQRLQAKLIAHFKPKDAHSNQVAVVRQGKDLAPEETIFVAERKTKARTSLERELSNRYGSEYNSLSEREVPTIGICFSGGGYRAMFATLGYLSGLDQIGVLNTATYVSGLSGSTWALAPWILSNQPSVDLFAEQFIQKVTVENIDHRDSEAKEILRRAFTSNSKRDLLRFMKMIITKKLYGQSVALVDYFAFTLSNPLLRGYHSKRFFQHKCSDLQKSIDRGTFPMPIFVCNERPVDGATWFEFTPYEFGSQNYRTYAPIWSFGRTFKRGRSIDTDPEQSLGYILGICGSGFAYNFIGAVPEIVDKCSSWLPYLLKLKKFRIIQKLLTKLWKIKRETAAGQYLSKLERYKFGAARIANPAYKLAGSRYSREKKLHLSDGGQVVFTVDSNKLITHGFASVPLLNPQRAVDIIIMCDSDRHGVKGEHLHASVMYAEQHKHLLKQFPPINYEAIKKPVVCAFQDKKDPTKPIILSAACIPHGSYLDRSYDPAQHTYTKTLNFAWLAHEANRHSQLAQLIINKRNSEDTIWRTIKEWVDANRPRNIVPPKESENPQTQPQQATTHQPSKQREITKKKRGLKLVKKTLLYTRSMGKPTQ